MISSIWLNKSDIFLLVCDGEKFFVYGDSPIANSIRGHTERGTGAFASIMKQAEKNDENDFDPVYYWYTSSMNFADESPPQPYSNKVLKNAQNWLAEQKHNSTKT